MSGSATYARRRYLGHYDVMTSKLYSTDMAKERLTVYLSPEVARALRVSAARRGIKDSEAVEEALREHFGLAALDRIAETATMDEDEALAFAVKVQHESRQPRRKRAS
jgi:hypothetical protein